MSAESIQVKNDMVANMNTIILSTIDNSGNPNSSYAPCLIDDDVNLYIYISKLSKHTQNLLTNNRVSAMIIEDESKAENLFARKRLTMTCNASLVNRDCEEWKAKIDDMEQKFGESIQFLRTLTDFCMFRMEPKSGLLVYGFGKAFRFKGRKLEESDHINDVGHTTK